MSMRGQAVNATLVGQVLWFNGTFGRIKSTDGNETETYMHHSVLKDWAGASPQSGDIVLYDREQSRRKPEEWDATTVRRKDLPDVQDTKNDIFEFLGREAIRFANEKMANAEYDAKARRIHAQVQHAIRILYPNAKVFSYGSHAYSLAEKDSDIDLAADLSGTGTFEIQVPSREAVMNLHRSLVEFLSAFHSETDAGEYLHFIETPVPHVCKPSPGLEWDLSVEPNGVRSSRWLRKYFKTSEYAASAMWLKEWFKKNDFLLINGRHKLTYAALVLFVYYIIASRKAEYHDLHMSLADEDPYPKHLGPITKGVSALQVGQLCAGFFKYYYEFDFSKYMITLDVNPVHEKVAKSKLGWKDPLCIKDLYNENENLGRCLREQKVVQLRRAFYEEAMNMLV